MNLSQRVAAGLIVAVVIQMVTALLWAGAAAQRLDQLESRLERLAYLEVSAARLEEQSAHLRAALARIEDKLDSALCEEKTQ